MPLYMDVHEVEGVDPDALKSAHERDLEVQGRFGVKFLRYWFSPEAGKIQCLVEAPSKDAAQSVHREAHGMVANEIYEVVEGE
ncbi:MAG TPA: DUF4242 domain-containing protein [Acidobacteria bacterium]|nr:DUF4242 domain-containing protein [Acidobacteriota bacterium]